MSLPSGCDNFSRSTASGIKELKPYVPGKPIEEVQRTLGLTHITKLASNENPLGASLRAVKAATLAAFDLGRYPDGGGHRLRNAIAEYVGVSAHQILLGNGSNDVLDIIARSFLEPGVNAVFSEHAFAVYPISTQAAGAQMKVVPALPADSTQPYGHDLSRFAKYIDENTRVVFIANPNNPTGTWITHKELSTFLTEVPSNVLVVLDEAYAEYIENKHYPDSFKLLNNFPNLIVTRTFSKAYGLAALRVGYGVACREICEILNRVRQPFNCNSVAQAAGIAALTDDYHLTWSREINNEGREALERGLAKRSLFFIPSVGNFVSFQLPEGHACTDVFSAMQRNGVIIRPVENYGLPRFLRVSVGTSEEISHFFKALDNVLE